MHHCNSMHLRQEVISWVVRLNASQRCSVFYCSLFRLYCETLQVMHCLHAGNVSCQSRSLQAIHVLIVIVHCLRWFPAYFIWPVFVAAGTVEFEYQSSSIASKICEDWCEALRAILDFQLLVFVRIMHALLQMHAGTMKHHCLQQYTVLNPEIYCPRSSLWLQRSVQCSVPYPAGSDSKCTQAQCFAIPGHCKAQMD